MANELVVTFNGVGANLYAIIRNAAGQVFRTTTGTFVAFDASDILDYRIVLTDKGGDMYAADIPANVAAGRYIVQFYEQIGANPFISDPLLRTRALVVGPAPATPSGGPYLTTLENVKLYMGITGSALDARLSQLIPVASEIVQGYCGTDFFSSDYDERYDGNAVGLNGGYLLLNNVPVTKIESITFEPDSAVWIEVVDGNDFIYDELTGLVQFDPDSNFRRAFWSGFRNIRVKYTAGFATIPETVDTATAMVVAALFQQANKDQSVYRERIGDYEYYLRDGQDEEFVVLAGAKPLLRSYKRVGFSA